MLTGITVKRSRGDTMSRNEDFNETPPIVGRTIWDIAVASSYIIGGGLFVIGLAIFLYFSLDEVPTWFYISIAGSLAFIPFLLDRAKEGADLFLVADAPRSLTEYRVGRRYGLNIIGQGVLFTSESGTYRTVLNGFDKTNKQAWGSSFGEFTQIDQVRDLTTLMQLSELLEDTLRETRLNAQTVGVEVEKQSKVIVDWALKTIYGAIIPTEVSEVFGVETEEKTEYEHKNLDELVDDNHDN